MFKIKALALFTLDLSSLTIPICLLYSCKLVPPLMKKMITLFKRLQLDKEFFLVPQIRPIFFMRGKQQLIVKRIPFLLILYPRLKNYWIRKKKPFSVF